MSTSADRLERLRQIVEQGQPMDQLGPPGGQAQPADRLARLREIVAQQAPAEQPGIDLSGLARTAAQGAALGFGEELEGLVAGAGALAPGGRTPGEAFSAQVEEARQDIERFREQRPGLAIGAELGGALIPSLLPIPGARAGLARAATTALRSPVGRAAIEGGIAGLGAAEGGLTERLPEAAIGTAAGGALGAAGRFIGGRLPRRPRTRAAEELTEAAEREGTDLTALAERLRGQPDAILPEAAEAGGPVQALTRQVTRSQQPGARELRRTLQERARGVPGEVSELLEREAKLSSEDVFQTAEQLATSKQARAAPLYERAFNIEVSDEGLLRQLDELFGFREFRNAYREGRRIAALEGVELPELFQRTREGVQLTARAVPVQAIDYMKRGLNDLVESGLRSGRGITRQRARGLNQRMNRVLNQVDELVPEYKAARATYAGDAALEDVFGAAREGSRRLGLSPFLREDPRRIQQVLRELTSSEQEFYRRGAIDVIRNLPPNRRVSLAFSDDPQVQRKLRQLFRTEQDYNSFRAALTSPRATAELGRVAGRAGQAPPGGAPERGALRRAGQLAGGLATTFIAPLRGRAQIIRALAPAEELPPQAMSQLGRLLGTGTPETFDELVRQLALRNAIQRAVPAAATTAGVVDVTGRLQR